MRRRDVIWVLAAAMVCTSPAHAQAQRHVIGFLSGFSEATPDTLAAFHQGLKETGFVEGKNLSIEFSCAGGHYDRLASLAAELVAHNVSVIVAIDVLSSFAAKAATSTIPIVFATGADPVKLGLVESFNQHRSNVTGVTTLLGSVGPKQLELLRELLPNSNKVALLLNPSNPNSKIDTPAIQAAADALGQHLKVLTTTTEDELEITFATMIRQRVDALVVKPDPFFISRRERLVALAAHHAIPAIYPLRVFVDIGGLMSYGGSNLHTYRQLGTYAG